MAQAGNRPQGDLPRAASDATSSPEEFAARFQESARVLWLIAVGIIGDRTRAEDVVQEAAVIALSKLDQFKAGTHFTAWMGQIVRYVALNHARREHRPAYSLDGDDADWAAPAAAEAPDPATRLTPRGELPPDQDWFDDRVMRALKNLGEIPRACLLLRVIEGLEYAEIARLLDIPEGTAMSHVHRTRQFLREKLAGMAPMSRGRKDETA